MSWQYRKQVKVGRNAAVNIGRRGLSIGLRLGPLSVNSRGRVSARLGKGLTWRIR